jgi:microcystin degradation protein MlrC
VEKFGRQLFALRNELSPKFLAIDEALDLALAEPEGPVVIADVSDNAGGGAPGDPTYILRRLVERGITNVASAVAARIRSPTVLRRGRRRWNHRPSSPVANAVSFPACQWICVSP